MMHDEAEIKRDQAGCLDGWRMDELQGAGQKGPSQLIRDRLRRIIAVRRVRFKRDQAGCER